ncbi:D-amino-acid N-acetyltransferase HPA3 [Paramyrothecium foliicola]|nr:D-amino-acid N-acetyltransferase HPA3 [Paramyrothecium foliicola]
MEIKIRPLAKEDEPQWRQLWEGYNTFYKRTISEDVTANTLSRFLKDDVEMFCAVAVSHDPPAPSAEPPSSPADRPEDIVGFVTWFPHPSTSRIGPVVYLNDLFVDPTARVQGIGGKLIDHVFTHSKEVLHAESVYWLTQHFNHAGQLLYVKKATKSDFVHYTKTL